jgi:hypothetical protein
MIFALPGFEKYVINDKKQIINLASREYVKIWRNSQNVEYTALINDSQKIHICTIDNLYESKEKIVDGGDSFYKFPKYY